MAEADILLQPWLLQPWLLQVWNAVLAVAADITATIARMLFWTGSSYSLVALCITLGIAAAFTLRRRLARRPVPTRVLIRALLPRRIWRSASGKADVAFTGFNIFVGPLLFGWAIIGQTAVAAGTRQVLTQAFGAGGMLPLPSTAATALTSVALFVAYELAYWLNHYLSHKLPFLWEFHAVHHSAESLSLATNFRVHPVDSIVFYNMAAVATGTAAGLCGFLFGAASAPVAGMGVLVLATAVLLTHLHHTHLWITFGESWGRVLLSPAHHQIHHSSDPAHHDRNFGNSLAMFDRLFGTLHAPAARRESLRFGVSDIRHVPHSFVQSMAMPCLGATRTIWRPAQRTTSLNSDAFSQSPAPTGS